MSATNYVAILPKDLKYELPNDSQIVFQSYAGKFSRRRHDTDYRSFDRFVKMATDLTVVETGPDPKDPNKMFVFCTCEYGMSGKVIFFFCTESLKLNQIFAVLCSSIGI